MQNVLVEDTTFNFFFCIQIMINYRDKAVFEFNYSGLVYTVQCTLGAMYTKVQRTLSTMYTVHTADTKHIYMYTKIT